MTVMWFLIALMSLLVLGIVYLTGISPVKNRTRQEFLTTLKDYLDGEIQPLEGRSNSYRIHFTFENQKFVYEDIETAGIYNKHFKTCLKTRTLSNITLHFQERRHKKMVQKEMVLASEIIYNPNEKQDNILVMLSRELQNFNVVTNDPLQANKLLKDPKVNKIFSEFKNLDAHGHPFMSLNIINGEIVLDFHPSGIFNPRPLYLHSSMNILEDYLKKVMILVKALKLY